MNATLALQAPPEPLATRFRSALPLPLRALLIVLAIALGAGTLAVVSTANDEAGAVSVNCTWYGLCTYSLTAWETKLAAEGAGEYLQTLTKTWWIKVALAGAADWAADRGLCLVFWFHPAYIWSHGWWARRC